jgi:UDP-N-acetylmuramate--alanine ligase
MTERYVAPEGSIPTLPVPDLGAVRRVHMIGIGGAGMRNLARLLIARGICVTGSDLKESGAVRDLRASGADVFVGHAAEHLGNPDAVVISSAITERNPELAEARRRGIEVWMRAQALAAAARDKRAIAVSGTHGKTTTTSMIGLLLERAGLDPTYVVGGEPNESGSGARLGEGDLFVAEADESDGSFLLFAPEVGIIANVEIDHVDFYRNGLAEIENAFRAFADASANVVACADDPGAMRSVAGTTSRVVTYGTGAGANVRLEVISIGPGGARGVVAAGDERADVRLAVDGLHNLLNAAAAVAAARIVGVPLVVAAAGLEDFRGVHRRFERRGSARGAVFYDDYGHVPTELAVTLDVARRTGPQRLIAVFQPHRYVRTIALWRELGASLTEADVVVVTDVYGAEQDPIPGVTGKLVVDGINAADPRRRIVYLPHRRDVIAFLDAEVRAGDLVITMGCGDVWMLGDAAIERIGADG